MFQLTKLPRSMSFRNDPWRTEVLAPEGFRRASIHESSALLGACTTSLTSAAQVMPQALAVAETYIGVFASAYWNGESQPLQSSAENVDFRPDARTPNLLPKKLSKLSHSCRLRPAFLLLAACCKPPIPLAPFEPTARATYS